MHRLLHIRASCPDGPAEPDVLRVAVLIRLESMESKMTGCVGGITS